MVDITAVVSGEGSNNSDSTQSPLVVTTPTHQGSVVREEPLKLEISLPVINEAKLGLSPPLKVYHSFLPLRRDDSNGHVQKLSLWNARKPCTLTGTQNGNSNSDQQATKLAHFWNWGGESEGQTQISVAQSIKWHTKFNLVIDQSLIESLALALSFPERFQKRLPAAERTRLFQLLSKKADEFIDALILRLDEKKVFETGRPISHVFADMIGCITFLKEQARTDGSKISTSKEFAEIEELRRCFWWQTLGLDNANSASWSDDAQTKYRDYLNREVNLIFSEVRNLLLLDPKNYLCPVFGPSRRDKQLRCHTLLRQIIPSTFRGDLFSAAGVKPGEVKPVKDVQEHLTDIDASFIHNGPFRLALTDDPSKHLGFDESGARPTILVLDSDTIIRLALLDLTGLMEHVGLPTFLTELLASHNLLFGSMASKTIALSLKSISPSRQQILRINVTILKDYEENWSSNDLSLQLSDFPIYGVRIQHVRKRMEDWRPLRLRQAWRRPYKDPLPYYGFWFGVFIGLTAILSVGINIAQLKQLNTAG